MEKDIRQSLQEHIFRLENRRRELMRPEYLRLGLTIGQGQPRILMYLLAEDGCSQREIAENCHLDVTTLSHAGPAGGKALERRINPQSRRECQVFLTEEGRKTAAEVCSCFRETEKDVQRAD
ncbi:MAG: MarR family winged helix-turn-helix transcriptional regulator [Gallintestinimicrobium sp.]